MQNDISKLIQDLHPSDQKIITQVIDALEDISQQTESFAKAAGISCLKGCGHCCENPDIHVTVTEILPLALKVIADGQEQAIMERIDLGDKRCVYFKPDATIKGNGQCGIYAYRPGICRFFGMSAVRGKNGAKQLFTCQRIKDDQSQQCAKANENLNKGMTAPIASDWGERLFAIDPSLDQQLLPINEAIAKAITKLSFHRREKS